MDWKKLYIFLDLDKIHKTETRVEHLEAYVEYKQDELVANGRSRFEARQILDEVPLKATRSFRTLEGRVEESGRGGQADTGSRRGAAEIRKADLTSYGCGLYGCRSQRQR